MKIFFGLQICIKRGFTTVKTKTFTTTAVFLFFFHLSVSAQFAVNLKDIAIGTTTGVNASDFSFSDGTTMYFVATTNGTGYELWKTDGTNAATIKLSNIGATTSTLGHWNLLNGKYVFSMFNSATLGRELYVTDGTVAGTTLLKDIAVGTTSSIGGNDFSFSDGTTMYFVATTNGTSYELWKTNGTTAGTIKLSNIGGTTASLGHWYLLNGKYVFSMINAATLGRELYITDGTVAGTTLLKEIAVGTTSGIGANDFSFSDGTTMYFVATTNGTSYELWKTNGTNAGTSKLSNIGGTSSTLAHWNLLNGKYVFSMNNASTLGRELYITDGTVAGTTLLKDIAIGTTAGVNATDFSFSDGTTMYFVATTNGTIYELWKTNATTAGTIKLSNIGGTNSTLAHWNLLNGKYVFSMNNSTTYGRELYITDGTVAGTTLLKDIAIGTTTGVNTNYFSFSDGTTMYFVATINGSDHELWKTNGTAAGTIQLSNISATSYILSHWNIVNGKYVFSMNNNSTIGRELYITDGTVAGTTLLKDISIGLSSGLALNASGFSYSDGATMYFVASSNGTSYELWKTNGTLIGTTVISNIAATSAILGHWNLLNGKYIFSMSNTQTIGRELWYVTPLSTNLPTASIEDKMRAFPNPFTDIITIQSSNTLQGNAYQLHDNLGRILITNIFDASNAIDLSSLAKGVYYLRTGSQSFKLIKN